MKKYELELFVACNDFLDTNHFSLVLRNINPQVALPEMRPGQFVQILVEDSPNTVLRRPISINWVNRDKNEMGLLVQVKGEGTRHLANLRPGDLLNVLLPLGNGFSIPTSDQKVLLVGGGVGIAPMLHFGQVLAEQGREVTFLLGARNAEGLLELERFEALGTVFTTTEDGSAGEKGFVTQHSALQNEHFDHIAVCGPKPMMLAMARYAHANGINCEVSLENMMACGLGACLCCVEKTVKGNVCACKEGPVFNINQLLWQI